MKSPVQISPHVECIHITLAGVGRWQVLLWITAGVVCTVSSTGDFCVAVDEVRLTGNFYQINVYVLSYVVC